MIPLDKNDPMPAYRHRVTSDAVRWSAFLPLWPGCFGARFRSRILLLDLCYHFVSCQAIPAPARVVLNVFHVHLGCFRQDFDDTVHVDALGLKAPDYVQEGNLTRSECLGLYQISQVIFTYLA